jgi:hypothetical protein
MTLGSIDIFDITGNNCFTIGCGKIIEFILLTSVYLILIHICVEYFYINHKCAINLALTQSIT